MKKRTIAAILLTLLMALGLCACGDKTTAFHTDIYDGGIVVDGKMPETFKLVSRAEEEAAAKAAEEKGETHTPGYVFNPVDGQYALVGPDYVIEFDTFMIDPNFAGYQKNYEEKVSEFYPILKKDVKVDGRDAFYHVLASHSGYEFALSINVDDFSPNTCYSISLVTLGGKAQKSEEEMLDFIENNADFNAIINSLKFSINSKS